MTMTTENSNTLMKTTETDHNATHNLEIEKHIENVITEVNSDAVFECKVDGDPLPKCAWFKNGQLINSSQRIKITSNGKWHQLAIDNVKLTDHGLYTFVCRNSSQQISSKANLFIAHGNLNDGVFYTDLNIKSCKVLKHLCDVKIVKGEVIELESVFMTSDKDINIIWYKNNDEIHRDNRSKIVSSETSTLLRISQSELQDSGIYYVVVTTKEGILSSFADVQVTDVKEHTHEDELKIIEEVLPKEIETNENEEIRLICKANTKRRMSVSWYKNDNIFSKSNFTAEDFGNHYLGLIGLKVSKEDAGYYRVNVRDEEDENDVKEEYTYCFLSVNPAPVIPPSVILRKPLRSAVACCGSKLAFHCSFDLKNPTYFYVIWTVGCYTVERTNSRFCVICKDGEFILYIKKLEPGMAGEVICELRRALPDVPVNRSSCRLTIVPQRVIQEEKKLNTSLHNGTLYSEAFSHQVNISDARKNFDCHLSARSNGNGVESEIFEITYCRLDNDIFFLEGSNGYSDVSCLHVTSCTNNDLRSSTDVVTIEWDDSAASRGCWYGIECRQSDGSYAEAGMTSVPSFDIRDTPISLIMVIRIKTETAREHCQCQVCILPSPVPVQERNEIKIKTANLFNDFFTKTDEVIGKGAFGSVELIQSGATGKYYAAKILKTKMKKKRDAAVREFDIMKKLQHPKLVALIDAFEEDGTMIFVMEFLWGGELFHRMVEEEDIKEEDVVPYVKQICEGLEYLHTFGIAHLDLKPENIVCLSPNSREVKIIDFGLARVLEKGKVTRMLYGSRDYIAPEVLNFDELSLTSDMWSLGVITYVLLSGVVPFVGEEWHERSANITAVNYNYEDIAFNEISDLAKEFIDKLLVRSPQKRMTASAALKHVWIIEGPPKGAKAGHMKRTRENLKTYLASYRAKWQRAGNVMIAAHRLRTHAGSSRTTADEHATPGPT